MFWEEVGRALVERINDLLNARWSFLCAVILLVLATLLLVFADTFLSMWSDRPS